MTTIVWDGKNLATDTKVSGHKLSTVSKLMEHEGWKLAICGDWAIGTAKRQWFIDGRQKAEWSWKDDDSTTLVAISPEGLIYSFTKEPIPMHFTSKQEVWGSGSDFALTALHLGKNAIEACQVAIELDDHSGGTVEYL